MNSDQSTINTSSTEISFKSTNCGEIIKKDVAFLGSTETNSTKDVSKIVHKENNGNGNANGNGNGNANGNGNLLYAINKNAAEGLMDIALLSANANQLRFLVTYNHKASTFYISLTLVAISLILQVLVGIALIFKRRFHRCRNKRYNELVVGGVFIITVVNILLAAFTTTNGDYK